MELRTGSLRVENSINPRDDRECLTRPLFWCEWLRLKPSRERGDCVLCHTCWGKTSKERPAKNANPRRCNHRNHAVAEYGRERAFCAHKTRQFALGLSVGLNTACFSVHRHAAAHWICCDWKRLHKRLAPCSSFNYTFQRPPSQFSAPNCVGITHFCHTNLFYYVSLLTVIIIYFIFPFH